MPTVMTVVVVAAGWDEESTYRIPVISPKAEGYMCVIWSHTPGSRRVAFDMDTSCLIESCSGELRK